MSRGNVFTIPKTVVSFPPSHTVVSSQPFINPAARHTGPVVSPAIQEELYKKGEARTKKKQKKSSKDKTVPDSVPQNPVSALTAKNTPGPGDDDDMPAPVFQSIQSSAVAPIPGSHFTGSEKALTGSTDKITGSSSTFTEKPVVTGHGSTTGHFNV